MSHKTGATRAHKDPAVLTEREAQILALRHEGKTYKQIAEMLGLKERSVDTMLQKARQKNILR